MNHQLQVWLWFVVKSFGVTVTRFGAQLKLGDLGGSFSEHPLLLSEGGNQQCPRWGVGGGEGRRVKPDTQLSSVW